MVNINLNAPRPGMTAHELDQFNQRIYDALLALAEAQGGVTVISDHNDLANNGGDNSHASIAAHMNSKTAHGTSSDVVGKDDAQKLTQKVISGNDNTISDLKHGSQVDNPTKAHGVDTVAGVIEQQRFENKTELEPYLVVTANYAIKVTDKIVKVINPVTVSMPTAVGVAGQVYRIENASVGIVVITPKPGELISDETSQELPVESTIILYSDGIGWRFS